MQKILAISLTITNYKYHKNKVYPSDGAHGVHSLVHHMSPVIDCYGFYYLNEPIHKCVESLQIDIGRQSGNADLFRGTLNESTELAGSNARS